MAVERIHRHKAGAQEVFVVPDGVHRSHHRIFLAMPGETDISSGVLNAL
jgi:hypothetical protein